GGAASPATIAPLGLAAGVHGASGWSGANMSAEVAQPASCSERSTGAINATGRPILRRSFRSLRSRLLPTDADLHRSLGRAATYSARLVLEGDVGFQRA